MRIEATLLLLLGLSAGCTSTPGLSGVEPTHGDCALDIPIRIRGSALGTAVQVDLQEGSVGHVAARIGDASLQDVVVLSGAVITGTLPGGRLTAGGDYDVVVYTSRGGTATLEGAFHCDGEPPVDAGDEGADGPDDGGADDGVEADASGPVGPILTLSESATTRYGSAPSVAWVADRWVVAWVDDDGGDGRLRLAEIYPGETAPAAVRDLDAATAGRPVDPLVRAWSGMVWLAWLDRSTTPGQFRFRLFDDALGVRALGGSLGNAEADVFWRRDHDVARAPASGALLFVGPMLGGPAYALVLPDGSLAVRATVLPSGGGGVADLRAVWAGDGFRVLWTENPAAGGRARGAVVTAAGVAAGAPFDLPLGGGTEAPVGWVDDRTEPAHLFLCYERVESSTVRRIAHRTLDLDLGSPTDEVLLPGTGRLARCAAAGGLLAWSLQDVVSSVVLAGVEADGSTTAAIASVGRAVRAMPGADLAAAPGGGHALVWVEDRAPGEPVALRFAEVAAGP